MTSPSPLQGECAPVDELHRHEYAFPKSPDSSMATKRAKKTDIVSPSSAELRKAVEAIAIQPKSGKITLLTRKLFNVLLAVAQQADESGDTYRALLSDIVANAAFDSNDTALVKEHLRRMVSVQVEWSTKAGCPVQIDDGPMDGGGDKPDKEGETSGTAGSGVGWFFLV